MNTKSRYNEAGLRRCPTCDTFLDTSAFHVSKRQKDGLAWQCKSCQKDRRQKYHYKKTYGISLEERNQLINIQGNKCGCCGNEFDNSFRGKPVVDHCHKSGKIREILCDRCNVALGVLGDDPELALKCMEYLQKHQ